MQFMQACLLIVSCNISVQLDWTLEDGDERLRQVVRIGRSTDLLVINPHLPLVV